MTKQSIILSHNNDLERDKTEGFCDSTLVSKENIFYTLIENNILLSFLTHYIVNG